MFFWNFPYFGGIFLNSIVLRILDLIEKNNCTDQMVVKKSELSRTAISDWRRGKANPSIDAIIKLASFFQVSTDYLLTGKSWKPALSPEDHEWLELIHSLPADKKDMCKGYLKGVADASACSPKHTENTEKLAVGK